MLQAGYAARYRNHLKVKGKSSFTEGAAGRFALPGIFDPPPQCVIE
jgi:hypothetical protein